MIVRARVSSIVAGVLSLAVTASCGRVQSAGTETSATIRMSTGFPSGNFRPFSEALIKGYAQLMPDIRIRQIDTRGSLGNIQGLEDGTVDVGLSQAGIAYMAYNGRLRHSVRAMRAIRGIAILNSSAVHLLVSPRSRIRSRTSCGAVAWVSARAAAAPPSSRRRCCAATSRRDKYKRWTRPFRRPRRCC